MPRSLRRKAKGQRAGNSSSSRRQEIGRPGPVDRRAQRAQELGGRPASRPQPSVCRNPNSRVLWVDRPVDRSGPVCRNPTLGFSGSTVPVDRKRKQVVGRPAGRPTDGFGRKSAAPQIWVFKAVLVSRICKQSQRLREKKGCISLAFKEVASKL